MGWIEAAAGAVLSPRGRSGSAAAPTALLAILRHLSRLHQPAAATASFESWTLLHRGRVPKADPVGFPGRLAEKSRRCLAVRIARTHRAMHTICSHQCVWYDCVPNRQARKLSNNFRGPRVSVSYTSNHVNHLQKFQINHSITT